MLATCARCLCEFPTEIEGEVDGFYVDAGTRRGPCPRSRRSSTSTPSTGSTCPSIMAALVLEAPFAPLHDENCARAYARIAAPTSTRARAGAPIRPTTCIRLPGSKAFSATMKVMATEVAINPAGEAESGFALLPSDFASWLVTAVSVTVAYLVIGHGLMQPAAGWQVPLFVGAIAGLASRRSHRASY